MTDNIILFGHFTVESLEGNERGFGEYWTVKDKRTFLKLAKMRRNNAY